MQRYREIANILTITKACVQKMQKQGIIQWNEHYPRKEAFANNLERNELDGKAIGATVISTHMDGEYVPIERLTPNGNDTTYVHRVCVHPRQQGKGYAQELMDFAENHSRANGFDLLRLNTFLQNRRNQSFYEQRGYQKLGDVFFRKKASVPFIVTNRYCNLH